MMTMICKRPCAYDAAPVRGRAPGRCLRGSGLSDPAFYALVRTPKQASDGRPRQQQGKDQRCYREETTKADAISHGEKGAADPAGTTPR